MYINHSIHKDKHMAFERLRHIPEPEQIIAEMPVPADIVRVKRERDAEIAGVLDNRSGKFLVIVGPCSAHDEDQVCDYVSRLAKVNDSVKEKLVIVPRIYTSKPRTIGSGYKGMLHQPDPAKGPNIVEGIRSLRRLHLRAIRESGFTAADEMLYPTNHPYLDDLLSYVAVGARSVENQQHRLTASGITIPAGMKNPTSGDLQVMLNSIQTAQHPHVFTYNGWEVQTSGNAHAHAILRGAVDRFGQSIPNYHYEDLVTLHRMYVERKLKNPAVIVDTNHANSSKQFREQPRVALEIMQSRKYAPELTRFVRGLMIESFIIEGAQDPDDNVYGQSITDPCLGWDDTVTLLKRIAQYV